MKTHCQPGFTIVELLVVVTVMALLVSMLLPSMAEARRVTVRIRCMSQIQQNGRANLTYATDAKDVIVGADEDTQSGCTYMALRATAAGTMSPAAPSTSVPIGLGRLVNQGYLTGTDSFWCPGRQSTNTNVYDLAQANPLYGASTWNAWVKNGTVGQVHTAYLQVVTDRVFVYKGNPSYDYYYDYTPWGQVSRSDTQKLLSMDFPFSHYGFKVGKTSSQHGTGQNCLFFDGSARFVLDPTGLMETQNLASDQPNQASLNYVMLNFMGWDSAKFLQNYPTINHQPF